MAYLIPNKIIKEGGVIINQKLTPDGYSKKPNASMNIMGVTVHNTGMISTAAATNPAEQYARATYPNGNMGFVAVHYWVYKNIVWQQLRDNEQGWHAGKTIRQSKRGKAMSGNRNTISIEIIGNDPESEKTGQKLVALLCRRHGLDPLKDVYTHNFWMYGVDRMQQGVRKNCPIYILDHWSAFLGDVKAIHSGDKGYFEKGDTGAGVKKLQEDLSFIGFNPSGGIDGSFGPGTEAAVKSFQQHYNLTVDGMAGPQTLAKIAQLVDMRIAAEKKKAEMEKAAAELAAEIAIEEAARKKAEAEAKAAAEEAAKKKEIAPEGMYYKVVTYHGAFKNKEGAEETMIATAAELKAKGVKVNGQEPITKIILE